MKTNCIRSSVWFALIADKYTAAEAQSQRPCVRARMQAADVKYLYAALCLVGAAVTAER